MSIIYYYFSNEEAALASGLLNRLNRNYVEKYKHRGHQFSLLVFGDFQFCKLSYSGTPVFYRRLLLNELALPLLEEYRKNQSNEKH